MFTYRPLRGVQNFYIVSLAVSDLAVALLVMPLNVANFVLDGRWAFGVVVCHVWLTADILTCTASILNLCAIALDRYRAIHDPIGYAQRRTIRRVLTTVAVVWTTSAVISVPPLVGWNAAGLYNETTRRCQLTDDRGFVVYSAAGSFYIPLALMTFVYVKIYIATRRRLRARTDNYRSKVAATSASVDPVAGGTAKAPSKLDDDRVQPVTTRADSYPEPELMTTAHGANRVKLPVIMYVVDDVAVLHYHSGRGDDRVQQSLAPSHRQSRTEPEVPEVPSIESLTNDDGYDVDNDNGDVELRSVAASAPSSAVACGCRKPEAVIDRDFRLNPPHRSNIKINQQSADVAMMSVKGRLSEVDVHRHSGTSGNDVTQLELNFCGGRCVSESFIDRRQEIAGHVITGFAVDRPEVKITAATRSDCADVAVCGRSTNSAEVKGNASTELKTRSSFRRPEKKRRWSAETGSRRRLSRPRFVGQSKCSPKSTVGNPQLTPRNGSSILDLSISGRSEVVGRVMAEKQNLLYFRKGTSGHG